LDDNNTIHSIIKKQKRNKKNNYSVCSVLDVEDCGISFGVESTSIGVVVAEGGEEDVVEVLEVLSV